jgi:hypothetical protein
MDRQSESQVIKRGSDVVDTIPDQQTHTVGDWVGGEDPEAAMDAYSIESSMESSVRKWIRVWFIDDYIWLGFEPVSGLRFQALQMLTSPVEFQDKAPSHGVTSP